MRGIYTYAMPVSLKLPGSMLLIISRAYLRFLIAVSDL